MSKKIMLLALAVASVAAFAVPSMAMAEDLPLHIEPAPANGATSSVTGGVATLSTVGGTTVTCNKSKGTVTWENGTTGHIVLTFEENCKASLFGASCTSITTTSLPFHLVTAAGAKPAVLITPGEGGHFATFTCGAGLVKVVVTGNGIVGTITSPVCGGESSTAGISFKATKGVQEDKLVEGTTTSYHLLASVNGGAAEEAGQEGSGTLTFSEGKKKLNCT
jgi:hypothetical protein